MSTVATQSQVSTTKQITLNSAQIEILDGILVGTIRVATRLEDEPLADKIKEILREVRS